MCTSSKEDEAWEVLKENGSECCLAKGQILQFEISLLQEVERDLICLSV